MAIASTAISEAPISGVSVTRSVVVTCNFPWGTWIARKVFDAPYSIRLTIGFVARCGVPIVTAQNSFPYGSLVTVASSAFLWDDCVVVKSSLTETYGPLLTVYQATFPYSAGHVSTQCIFPVHGTVAKTVSFGWRLQEAVRVQCEMPWGSTTTVATQGSFPYKILPRDPVSVSLIAYWDLSTEQLLRPNAVVRAFHFGALL